MRVHIGCDHAGLDLKAHLVSWLTEHGYEPVDHGPFVYDPLCGEGEHLAGLLADAGVAVTATRYLGQLHGFWRHAAVFPAAEAVLRQTASFLQQHP